MVEVASGFYTCDWKAEAGVLKPDAGMRAGVATGWLNGQVAPGKHSWNACEGLATL